MQNEFLDSVWGLAVIGGPVLLTAILGYGLYRNHNRDKRMDAVTEAATREQYKHPDRRSPMP